mgnify:CR=1 FL=1
MRVEINENVDFNKINEEKDLNFTSEVCEGLNALYKACSICYPERFQIQISTLDIHPTTALVIYFPEVVMTNRNNKRHTITDVLVRVSLNTSRSKLTINTVFEITRTSFSINEIFSGYVHSHTNSYPTNNEIINKLKNGKIQYYSCSDYVDSFNDGTNESSYYSGFCMGSGGINNILTQFNAGTKQNDVNLWILILRNIKVLISYESLEGGPYKIFDSVERRDHSKVGRAIRFMDIELNTIDFIRYNKSVIGDIMCRVASTIKFFINEKGLLDYTYDSKYELELYSILNEYQKQIGNLSELKYVSCLRKQIDNGYQYYNANRAVTSKIKFEDCEKIEKYCYKIGSKEIPFRVTDKETLVSGRMDDYDKCLHPVFIKKLIDYYVTYCNFKESHDAYTEGRLKIPASDF